MLNTPRNLSCEQVASSCPSLPQSGDEPATLAQSELFEPEEHPRKNALAFKISPKDIPEYLAIVAFCLGIFCLIMSGIVHVAWINILSFCFFINHHPSYVIFSAIGIGMLAGACWYAIYDMAHELDADIAAECKTRWRLVDDKFSECERCAHRTPTHEGRGHTCPHSSLAVMDGIATAYEKQFGKDFFDLQLEARTQRSYIWSEALPPPLHMTRKAKTLYLKQVRAENIWLSYRLGKCQECWHYWNCSQPGPKNEKPFHIRIGTKHELEERAKVLKTRPVADTVPVDRQTKKFIRLIEQRDPENPMLSDVVRPPSDEELEQRRLALREKARQAEIAALEHQAQNERACLPKPASPQERAEQIAWEISRGFRKNPAEDQPRPAMAPSEEESGPPIALSTAKPQEEPAKRGRGRPRKYPKDSTLA